MLAFGVALPSQRRALFGEAALDRFSRINRWPLSRFM